MQRTLGGMVLLVLACSSAHAALVGRSPATLNGTDYRAYYDTDTNLTWVADADLAKTSGRDTDGFLNFTDAVAWTAELNAQDAGRGYLGVNNWRLPTVTDTGLSGCDGNVTGTDCGYNVDLGTGEMARMFYGTLNNEGNVDTSGELTECGNDGPHCLSNDGPFSNLQPNFYWSGTAYAPNTEEAWYFHFGSGQQDHAPKIFVLNTWAVRPGDIGDVPFDDADSDGVADAIDNCTNASNATQCDSDGDGYGNHCDGDLNNNGFTNAFDTPLYRAQLGQPSVGPTFNKADLNCNGFVNAFDTPLYRSLLGKAPGPSGLVP